MINWNGCYYNNLYNIADLTTGQTSAKRAYASCLYLFKKWPLRKLFSFFMKKVNKYNVPVPIPRKCTSQLLFIVSTFKRDGNTGYVLL